MFMRAVAITTITTPTTTIVERVPARD